MSERVKESKRGCKREGDKRKMEKIERKDSPTTRKLTNNNAQIRSIKSPGLRTDIREKRSNIALN